MKTTNLHQNLGWLFSASAIVAVVLCLSRPIYAQSEDVWESRQHLWYAGRQGHDMAYIGGDQTILFGGYNNGRFQDTWIYDSSVGDWEPGDQNLTVKPSHRYNHAMAYIGGDKVVLFSGNASGGFAGDTWIYDLSARNWTQKYPPDPKPSSRSTHAMAYIGDDKALLFSGYYYEIRNYGTVTYNKNNDTWIYDQSANTWTQQNSTSYPINRSYAAMAYIGGGKVVLFGGDHKYRRTNGGTNIFNNDETWVYDLTQNTWTQKNPSVKPHERSRHAMAYIGGDQVVMFGGGYEEITGTGTVGKWLDDTWVYDLSENNWTEYTHNYHPSARSSHSFSETSMDGSTPPVLFGGIDSDGYPMELWSFNGGEFIPKDPTYITVTHPNGGELWVVGNTYNITWTTDHQNGFVVIRISTTGGSSWSDVGPSTENDGYYSYTPDHDDISGQCLIRVSGSDITDQSDNVFTTTATPAPTGLRAFDGYNGAVPVAWTTPPGTETSFSSSTASAASKNVAPNTKFEERSLNVPTGSILGLKSESQQIESNTVALQGGLDTKMMRDKLAIPGEIPGFSLHSQGSVPEVLSYNIYRSTSSGGSYTKIVSNLQRQYYRDEIEENGVYYYYKITAVYNEGESDFTYEVRGRAQTDGYTMVSGWSPSAPTLDGIFTPGEWSDATPITINDQGVSGSAKKTFLTMNNGTHLFLGVQHEIIPESSGDWSITVLFDTDLNREWPSSSPSSEGMIQQSTWPHSPDGTYVGINGYWPFNYNFESWMTPSGVNKGINFSNGYINSEISFDLATSPINAAPGDTIGILFHASFASFLILEGAWPQATTDLFDITQDGWAYAPFSYGDLVLAEPGEFYAPTNLVALNDYHNVVPLAWSTPSEQVVSYKVYRSTNSGGPYTIIAENVVRQYYRDETVANSQTYYYVVKAFYGTGKSGYSDEAAGQPQTDGYVIKSGLATSAPTLDGMIKLDEWSEAATTNITYPGYTGVVTLYIMNDNNYLYVAVDDGRDNSQEDRDQFALFFDDDLNREFPPSAPSGEGVIWVAWDAASSSSFSEFGSRYGYWPGNIGSETNIPTPGVNHAMSLASGNVQYEGSYDLRTSPINAYPGEIIGILSYTFDKDPNSFNAFWPQQVVGLGAITPGIGSWSVAPFSYGDLVLAFSPTDNILINGDFSNGETGWNLTVLGAGQATSTVQNGEYAISITHGGNFMWDLNLTQGNLPIENGKTYNVSFDAYAAAPRQIAVLVGKNSDPWTVYSGVDNFKFLTTSRQNYSYSFTMNNPTDPVARVGFDVGLSTDDVYFDNITLTEDLTQTCTVWPGDNNNDGVVTASDVLPIGLYYDKTGPIRPNASLLWSGQSVTCWDPEAATFADAGGNGKVGSEDVLPIGLNFGKTHTTTTHALEQDSISSSQAKTSTENVLNGLSQTAKIKPVVSAITGDSILVDILITDVTGLFGLSFDFVYNDNSGALEALSALADPFFGSDILFFPNINTATKTVSVGMSRKAGQGGINGTGNVARVTLKGYESAPFETSVSFELQNVTANDANGNSITFTVESSDPVITDVDADPEISAALPESFMLSQNYPNPFNPETTIAYQLPQAAEVALAIYDLQGHQVRMLDYGKKSAGYHAVKWNGRNKQGLKVASGIYFYRIEMRTKDGGQRPVVAVKKMILMK